jgi:RNA polymerase subunit RPABC4/transcription elongation factor Spt4
MGKEKKIKAEFDIVIHPELDIEPSEVVLMYSVDGEKSWDDYYGNKLGTPKNWNVTVFDLTEGHDISFFIRFIEKSGKIFVANKEGRNYNVTIRENQPDSYKAQIRIKNIKEIGMKCVVCGTLLNKGQHTCPNSECGATFCAHCKRMLPPSSNYCPWCKKEF